MLTSAQRFWLEKDLRLQEIKYSNFIEALLEAVKEWNYKTIPTYFSQPHLNVGIGDLAFLSLMQHYGMPTPLLDFTSNPLVGLYFSVEPSSYLASYAEIDNYSSLYMVDITDDPDKPTIFQKQREKLGNIIKEHSEDRISFKLIPEGLLYIDDKSEEFKILNSMNISNQSGSFFFNSFENLPLEMVYKDMTGREEKFARCVNIHKNLRPYALSKLADVEDNPITKDYIFPDIYKIAENALSKALATKSTDEVDAEPEEYI